MKIKNSLTIKCQDLDVVYDIVKLLIDEGYDVEVIDSNKIILSEDMIKECESTIQEVKELIVGEPYLEDQYTFYEGLYDFFELKYMH